MSTKLGGEPRLYSPKKNVIRRPSVVLALIVKLPSGMSIGSVGTSLKRAKPMLSASAAVMTGSCVMSAMEGLLIGPNERKQRVSRRKGLGIRQARKGAAAAAGLARQLEAIGEQPSLLMRDEMALALEPPQPASRLLADT